MNKLQMFLKAVYAGFMIGIGGIVYLSVENRVAGSMLFSFGKVGFARTGKALLDMPLIVAGNYVGTFVAAMLARGGGLAISTGNLVMGKLDKSMGCVFVLSVFCGVLMYLAIDNYNKTKNIVFIIAPVMIFILSGFEHSIANMFYFHLAGVYHGKALVWLLVMVVGHGVGAWVFGMKKGDCVPGNSRI